ncbi:hypothetical protein QTO34_000417, partial [Cnephaeus nilssonii]
MCDLPENKQKGGKEADERGETTQIKAILEHPSRAYDHFSRWVEAFFLSSATAGGIIKVVLEHIVPRFSLVENIDSDNGSHFTSKVLKGIMESLDIDWDYNTPWHPPSWGRVERMNQTLKKQITKLILETKLPWTKCLPIALIRIRTVPRKNIGLSPYEMLYGIPYL